MLLSRSTLLEAYLVIITVAAAAHLDHDFPIPPQQCEISIRVDPTADSDWRAVYTQYTLELDKKTEDQTLNLTCNELQEALVAINSTIFHKSNSCIEVVISRGMYYITESVEIAQNVHIQGEQAGGVFVDFSVNAPTNVPFFNILTFINADHVEISDIEFSNSPGIIAVENVTLVRVSDSSFRWFSRGALDIYQCFIVTVTNCVFEDNGFVGVTKFGYQYRGHAGGLSVGYDDNHYNTDGTDLDSVPDIRGIHISGCTFRNNTSDPQESGNLISTSALLQDLLFPGRGGAIAITINSTFAYNASIEDCVIENNHATSFGGGIYLGYSVYAPHATSVNRTMFVSNHCDGPSGGLQLGFVEGGVNGVLRLDIYNSEFYDNHALFGGAIQVLSNATEGEDGIIRLNNEARIKNCTFMRNSAVEYGAALCLASPLLFLRDYSNVQPLAIINCTFVENIGGRAGVLSTAYFPLAFFGQNNFFCNTGRVLVISGTRVEIHGLMHFLSNDGRPLDAGALYVTSFGQLQLHSGAKILFENNTGVLGASITVVSIASLSESYSNLLYNPLCVLRSENSTDRPQDWQNVNIHFTGNEALFGSTVLLNEVNLCSWTSLGPVFFNHSDVFRWNFIDFSEDNVNRAHFPEDTNPAFYVQTPARHIFLTNSENVTAFPGQAVNLNVTGVDQLGLHTPVAIYLSDNQGVYHFSPSAAAPALIQNTSISTKFFVKSYGEESFPNLVKVAKNITINTIFTQTALSLPFPITPKECPAGHVLAFREEHSEIEKFCDCNEADDLNIIDCDNWKIILFEGQWGIDSKLTGAKDSLVTYPCPPQYCHCFENRNKRCNFIFDPSFPDAQCHRNRKGELCGDCRNETAGFTALLDRCETCEPVNGLLILALHDMWACPYELVVRVQKSSVIADAVVIGLLLLVKFPPSSWLYPALFYLQAVPYLALHFPVTFEVVHPYVYYVSSALSFYFVYDFCLGPQFSAISVYFIRFIPFLVSVAVTIPVTVFRYRYNLNNRPWSGLWWVVLFQYTHVVYTCISILNCPMLPGDDGVISPRWYINGNITCFSGLHIPLALFACVVLLFCISIIPIILLYSLGYLKRPSWLLNSILPSASTFNLNSSWWCAVELTRRLIVIIFIIAIPRNSYPAIFCLMINVAVCLYIQPFKAMSANIIEAFLAADVLILLLMRETEYFKTFEYKNDSVISIHSSLLIPGYYIPLAFCILASCVSAILNIRSYFVNRKRALSASSQNRDPFDDRYDQSYYSNYRADHHPSTQSVELSNAHEIPLTRLWSYVIVNKRRNNRISDDGHGKRRRLLRGKTYPVNNKRKENTLSNKRERNTVTNLKSRVQRVTSRLRSRYRSQTTQSMPEEMMDVQGHRNDMYDSDSEAHEHIELHQAPDAVKGESLVYIDSVDV